MKTVAVQILVPIVPSCTGEAVQELVLAETEVETTVRKIGADGCWRKCSPRTSNGWADGKPRPFDSVQSPI